MADEYKTPNSARQSAAVLPSSGKADQLRREFEVERQSHVAVEPKPAEVAVKDNPKSIEHKLLDGKIIEAIRQVYDPEIPVNIHDLGLIYGIDIADDNSVVIRMTLTAPACPVAGSLPGEVAKKVETIPEVVRMQRSNWSGIRLGTKR